MTRQDNHFNFVVLRDRYRYFTYESWEYKTEENHLLITFHFNLNDEFQFKPEIRIPLPDGEADVSKLEILIFNMGMAELVSYWKAACSPKVIIKAGTLDEDQIQWWKKLYFLGLGEFFYLNSIGTNDRDFMDIIIDDDAAVLAKVDLNDLEGQLIPVGGGKDSVVSLELLEPFRDSNIPYIMNPRHASVSSVEVAGYKDVLLTSSRTIDEELLKLNRRGFLNGHTPFSSVLAFNSLLVASLHGIKYIVLSNEASADESTVPGTMINHQYSKTLEFENDFREYVNSYIGNAPEYFSLLRAFNEFRITGIFSQYSKYFKVFKSCNAGSKQDIWCRNCPKCLFVYVMLSAHLEEDQLVEIFGENLLAREDLKNIFKELCGITEAKPFECVGTSDEVLVSVAKYIERKGDDLPYLAQYLVNINAVPGKDKIGEVENAFYSKNNIPQQFKSILDAAMVAKPSA